MLIGALRWARFAMSWTALFGTGCTHLSAHPAAEARTAAPAPAAGLQTQVVAVSEMACPGEDSHPHSGGPEAGPELIDPDDSPDRVYVEQLELGNPGQGGVEHGRYAIALVSGATGVKSHIYEGEVAGEGGAALQLVDMDGDGRSEILVRESWNWMTCDLSGTTLVSKWLLLTYQGRILLQTPARQRDLTNGRPPQGFQETATVVRLHSGATAIAFRGGGRLRVVAAGANRAAALAEVSCATLSLR